jgi:tetratricopeptide (TPR) repeat protein
MPAKIIFVSVLGLSLGLGLGFAIPMFAQQEPREPKIEARTELNKGVAAFRAANYEAATLHFSNVVRLDPELKVGHLYLATAYSEQYVPGVETETNLDFANHALEQYAIVLQRDSANVTAIKSIAFLQMQLKHFSEAKEGYKKAVALDPTDPETFYSVGVVDWSMVYRDVTEEKSKLKLSSQDTLMGSPACSDLRTKELANTEDGMAMLKQAIKLRPDYDDAMVYMNLLYRLRADLDCHNKTAHAADNHTANSWADLAMAARKKKAEAEAKRTHDAATDVLQ